MAASDCHKLSIFGTGSSYKTTEGKQAWRTKIFLDNNRTHLAREIYDPCSEQEHTTIILYLEQSLAQEHDLSSIAAEAPTIIEGYRTKLFAQLDLHWSFSKPRIQIDVHGWGDQAETLQTDTIHRLQWELLEDPHYWLIRGTCATVRRIVAHAVKSPELERVCSWSTSDSINILLVVARHLPTDGNSEYQRIIPSSALSAIQNAQNKLNTRQGSPRIRLELVRPGTYQALQMHLEETTREKGRGYFHMVHFDLHGLVKDHTAYLRFANPDGTGELVNKPASDVAELLAANGVSSAVINACESATATKGVDANLSRIFAQKKIFNILAMSYKISSSAITIFLTSFYKNLLIQTLPFSEAAGRARETLREQRERQGGYPLRCDIHDWFVPVVYMGNRDLQITPRSPQLPQSPASRKRSRSIQDYWSFFISVIYRWLSLREAKRRSSSTDQARCRPQMICLEVDTFDDGLDYEDRLLLDGFVLNLENRMSCDHQIFLHGPTTAGKSFFLDQLSQLWLSTNFVERIYIIQARMFLDGWVLRLLRCLLDSIQGHSGFLFASTRLRTEDEGSNPNPRVIVIVDQLDQLFDDGLKPQHKARAKARVDAFLSNVVGDTRGQTYNPRPDLILVSRQDSQWFRDHFQHLDLDPTPIFLDSRPTRHHIQ